MRMFFFADQRAPWPHMTEGLFRYDPACLDNKQVQRLQDMAEFYTQERINVLLVPIITQKDVLSLRVLDWLVTNYAKKHNVVYEYAPRPGERLLINVYNEYKAWLRNYRRKNFDPFRRRERITFQTAEGKEEETTVGQLNFVYWAHTYGVLTYTRTHLHTIEQDMNRSLCEVKRQKEADRRQGKKRKRQELSQLPSTRCMVYRASLVTGFDSD
jgi:hypothetical protein